MPVCAGCFVDDYVLSVVREKGTVGTEPCEWCGSEGQLQVGTDVVSAVVTRAAESLCVRASEIPFPVESGPPSGETMGEVLANEFGLFSDRVKDKDELAAELVGFGYDRDEHWVRWDHWSVGGVADHIDALLHELQKSLDIYGLSLDLFEPSTVGSDDYIRRVESTLRNELRDHSKRLKVDSDLFRARIERNEEILKPEGVSAPPPHLATSGRVNVAGERVLYLADSTETAVAEVRPAIGDRVAVAKFTLSRKVKLCDLVTPVQIEDLSPFANPEFFKEEVDLRDCRRVLGERFARPIRPNDTAREYILTQYVARMIRRLDFDGIMFPSSQHKDGINFLLFDPTVATPRDLEHCEVQGVAYTLKRPLPRLP